MLERNIDIVRIVQMQIDWTNCIEWWQRMLLTFSAFQNLKWNGLNYNVAHTSDMRVCILLHTAIPYKIVNRLNVVYNKKNKPIGPSQLTIAVEELNKTIIISCTYMDTQSCHVELNHKQIINNNIEMNLNDTYHFLVGMITFMLYWSYQNIYAINSIFL